MIDVTNVGVQVAILSLVGVIGAACIAALSTALTTRYIKNKDTDVARAKSRDEELKEVAHVGLEYNSLIVRDLAAARVQIREEYENILKDDREQIAKLRTQVDTFTVQLAEQQLNLVKCQESHKVSVASIERLTSQIVTLTDRVTKHEVTAKNDTAYIKQLQEDLTAAGIPVRIRIHDANTEAI